MAKSLHTKQFCERNRGAGIVSLVMFVTVVTLINEPVCAELFARHAVIDVDKTETLVASAVDTTASAGPVHRDHHQAIELP